MTITAILLHYWPERTEHLLRLIEDLKAGSRRPDNIIVFNNNKNVPFRPIQDVVVVNSSYNFHCLVRYSMGLLAETDFCLFVDDDLTVQKNTLEELSGYAGRFPDAVLGFYGKILGEDEENPYTSGEDVLGVVEDPVQVDIVKGQFHFCKTSKLINAFVLKDRVSDLLINGVVEEDILLSLSNIILDNGTNLVVPNTAIELPENKVGYHFTKDHYPRRNETCRRILKWRRENER